MHAEEVIHHSNLLTSVSQTFTPSYAATYKPYSSFRRPGNNDLSTEVYSLKQHHAELPANSQLSHGAIHHHNQSPFLVTVMAPLLEEPRMFCSSHPEDSPY